MSRRWVDRIEPGMPEQCLITGRRFAGHGYSLPEKVDGEWVSKLAVALVALNLEREELYDACEEMERRKVHVPSGPAALVELVRDARATAEELSCAAQWLAAGRPRAAEWWAPTGTNLVAYGEAMEAARLRGGLEAQLELQQTWRP